MTPAAEPAAIEPHRFRCRVIYGDTDAGGVVYYAAYLRFLEAGRTEFMREQVESCRTLQARGLIMPVVECHVRYKASARYDDRLVVETRLTEAKRSSCRFDYRILREPDGRLLTIAYTLHAVVTAEGRLTRFPQPLLAGLETLITPPAFP